MRFQSFVLAGFCTALMFVTGVGFAKNVNSNSCAFLLSSPLSKSEMKIVDGVLEMSGYLRYENARVGVQNVFVRAYLPTVDSDFSEPFFLNHGLSSNSSSLGSLAREGARLGLTVIAIDDINSGRTLRESGVVSAPALDEDVHMAADVLRQLNVKSVHVVGHSRGGGVVLDLAGLYPDLVKSVTAIATYAEWLGPETVRRATTTAWRPAVCAAKMMNPFWWNPLTHALVEAGARTVETMAAETSVAWYNAFEPLTMRVFMGSKIGTFLRERPPQETVENLSSEMEMEGALQTVEGLRRDSQCGENVHRQAAHIQSSVPVRLIYDPRDELSPEWVNKKLAGNIRNVEVDSTTIAGRGHMAVRDAGAARVIMRAVYANAKRANRGW